MEIFKISRLTPLPIWWFGPGGGGEGGGGNSRIKGRRCSSHLSRVKTRFGFFLPKVEAFAVLLRYWAEKLRQEMCYFRIGENHLKQHPQNRFLVPLGVLFNISKQHLHAFYMGVSLPPPPHLPQGFGLSCFTVVLEWTTYKQSELTPERNLTLLIDKGLKERLDKLH